MDDPIHIQPARYGPLPANKLLRLTVTVEQYSCLFESWDSMLELFLWMLSVVTSVQHSLSD